MAHDVVNYGLTVGKDALKYSKSQPGVIKWTVEKVEGPVKSVLGSKIGQTAMKVGDRAITVADGTIDSAMNTGAYKSTSRIVKATYANRVQPVIKNRIVPATRAVTRTVACTTTAVTKPVFNAYSSALQFADKTVEWALPEADKNLAKEDMALPRSVVGLSRKITRRSVRKVAATRKMVVATAAYTFEQSKPANIKKNSVIGYNKALAGADTLVDTYLPEKDGLVGKTPVMLLKKFAKRGKTHTIATIRNIATAIRNSPGTFKKSCSVAYKHLTEHAMKLRNMKLKVKLMTVEDFKKQLTPYVTAVDKMLLKYRYTAAARNMALGVYTNKLAPILNPIFSKYLGNSMQEKPILPASKKPATSRSAPPPRAVESASPVEYRNTATAPETEVETEDKAAEEKPEKKTEGKGSKAKARKAKASEAEAEAVAAEDQSVEAQTDL